jgi:hypothetical protein
LLKYICSKYTEIIDSAGIKLPKYATATPDFSGKGPDNRQNKPPRKPRQARHGDLKGRQKGICDILLTFVT